MVFYKGENMKNSRLVFMMPYKSCFMLLNIKTKPVIKPRKGEDGRVL